MASEVRGGLFGFKNLIGAGTDIHMAGYLAGGHWGAVDYLNGVTGCSR